MSYYDQYSNLDMILHESREDFDKYYYNDKNGLNYKFIGVLIAEDDYYYAMLPVGGGKLELLSCVMDIETFGYEKVNDE